MQLLFRIYDILDIEAATDMQQRMHLNKLSFFTVQQALAVPNANRQMNWIQRLKLISTTRYRLVVWVVPHRWKGKVVFLHRKYWELDRIGVFPPQMARCVPSPPLCDLGWPSPPWCRPHPQMSRTKTRTPGVVVNGADQHSLSGRYASAGGGGSCPCWRW
jgi:hypothetical protein